MQLIFNSDGLDVRTTMAEVRESIDEKSVCNGVTESKDNNEKAINGITKVKTESLDICDELSSEDINSETNIVLNGDSCADGEKNNLEINNVNEKLESAASEVKENHSVIEDATNAEHIQQKEKEDKHESLNVKEHEVEHVTGQKTNGDKVLENNEAADSLQNENELKVDVTEEQIDVEDGKKSVDNEVSESNAVENIESQVTDVVEKMVVATQNDCEPNASNERDVEIAEKESSENGVEHIEQMDSVNTDDGKDKDIVDIAVTHNSESSEQSNVEKTIEDNSCIIENLGENIESSQKLQPGSGDENSSESPTLTEKYSVDKENNSVNACKTSDTCLELNEKNTANSASDIEIINLEDNVSKEQSITIEDNDSADIRDVDEKEIKKNESKEQSITIEDNDSADIRDVDEKEIKKNESKDQSITIEDNDSADIRDVDEKEIKKNESKEQSITIEDNDSADIRDVDEKEIKKNQDADCSLRLDDSSDDDVVCQDEVQPKSSDAVQEDKATEPMDVDTIEEKDLKDIKNTKTEENTSLEPPETKRICTLSNNLDILSDDDEPVTKPESPKAETTSPKCINLDDDDCVMLVDDASVKTNETSTKDDASSKPEDGIKDDDDKAKLDNDLEKSKTEILKDLDSVEDKTVKPDQDVEVAGSKLTSDAIEFRTDEPETMEVETPKETEIKDETDKKVEPKPLVPPNFLRKFKANLGEMTREELEEFCLMQIVEGVVDRSNLSEIKSKIKIMSQSMDEWRNKNTALTKQNRDLQIILKTVQEELKKPTNGQQKITPLKITRSVGLQVCLGDKIPVKPKKQPPHPYKTKQPQAKTPENPNLNKIPVPRLVPASSANPPTKQARSSLLVNSATKPSAPIANGARNVTPIKQVQVDKRPFSSVQSDTVDLTDDEPPSKQMAVRINPQPPVRLVSQNQLLTPRAQRMNNSPRKVFIPVGGQTVNRGTIMLKQVANPGTRQQRPATPMMRINTSNVRLPRDQNTTSHPWHPAPLPEAINQQQSPLWKALPPAPDLTISKVENGIVISWKITGYQEASYETIASYQLYAYQETKAMPNTALWKKIGDVKALPLPMACTLTQFMSGYKYYFAVRAVDIRSRIGPFSLPGSILLLNK